MSTTAYGRSKSGDRFYNPPARRQIQHQQHLISLQKNQNQQIQLQLQEKEQIRVRKLHNQRRQKLTPPPVASAEVVVDAVVEERRVELDDGASTATAVSSRSFLTNLDRFLEYTTPVVSAQCFSKTSMKEWRTPKDEFRPYFVLGDLWESFKEWSAYGAGVPLLLNGSDSVVQYYVPYLSGIQLYVDPSKSALKIRRPGEESDESSRETCSDGSSDCETERGLNSFGVCRAQEVAESNLQGIEGLSLRAEPVNGSSSDEGESSSSPSVLVFEYFEHATPFSREPLADKISLLASRFPELKTYRSCDLSSSSWISVAWYPIYRIPTGPTLQNLESCFLTFHSLSTPVSGGQNERSSHLNSCPSNVSNLPLPIFGMACYKFKISMWDQSGADESPKANSLLQAADDWLQHLNVNHPDYTFFTSHKYYWR